MIGLGRDQQGQQDEDDEEGDHGAVGFGSALQRISVLSPGREVIKIMRTIDCLNGSRRLATALFAERQRKRDSSGIVADMAESMVCLSKRIFPARGITRSLFSRKSAWGFTGGWRWMLLDRRQDEALRGAFRWSASRQAAP